MRYLSVTEIAEKWDVSERSVRNYCAHGRVNGAFLTGKTWNIPENAEKPERSNKKKEQPTTLLDILQEQKASKYSGGIYHKTQIDLTYNSNHIEGGAVAGRGVHLFPRIHQEYTFRHRSACRPPAESRQEDLTSVKEYAAAIAKSLQSCPTLCDPIDGSPPGSSIHGILQARTLVWVAISFSSA